MTDKAKKSGTRSAARLAAVQALYQIEVSGSSAQIVIDEFIAHRLGEVIEGDHYADADRVFFTDLVKGVAARQSEINGYLSDSLSEDWTLARIEPVARGILQAGIYELMARPDVPRSVVINEYVEVAKAFFEDNKPGFINGVLDRLAKIIRK